MNWLARLKSETASDIHATKPPQEDEATGFVGFVAPVPAPMQKTSVTAEAANDAVPGGNEALQSDPDRWCWPHSEAMTGREIDSFSARLARFIAKGVGKEDSEWLADRLVIRDRDGDGRRLCLECSNLRGGWPWRCGNWQVADLGAAEIPGDLVHLLQRCNGFS